MLKHQTSLLLLTISLVLSACQTTPTKPQIDVTDSVGIQTQSLPAKNIKTLDHKYFVIAYDTEYRLARYVSYDLTADQIKKSIPGSRKDSFRQDPLLKGTPAVVRVEEYEKSGYDKGHLANSADFTYSPEANRATFLMSNMVPQKPLLNQQAWRFLEEQVRFWACGEKSIKVITGPILKDNLPRLKSGLSIPQEFFKIVLDETAPKKMLVFVYSQEDANIAHDKKLVSSKEFKTKIQQQIPDRDFTSYPLENLSNWKSEDCAPKAKRNFKRY